MSARAPSSLLAVAPPNFLRAVLRLLMLMFLLAALGANLRTLNLTKCRFITVDVSFRTRTCYELLIVFVVVLGSRFARATLATTLGLCCVGRAVTT